MEKCALAVDGERGAPRVFVADLFALEVSVWHLTRRWHATGGLKQIWSSLEPILEKTSGLIGYPQPQQKCTKTTRIATAESQQNTQHSSSALSPSFISSIMSFAHLVLFEMMQSECWSPTLLPPPSQSCDLGC